MKSRFTIALVFVIALISIYVGAVRPRLRAQAVLAEAAGKSHISVNVAIAKRAAIASDLALPANVQAFQEASIYARTSGYLKKWYVDIGDRVEAGKLLAEIDAPEVDQELNQAKATYEQAKSNLALADSTATRWKQLGSEHAVAQQEVDEKSAALAARQADLQAVEATVRRLTQTQSYEKIVAPFAGVVAARNVDIGSLITNGSGGKELFRIAQTNPLRVYINVPQAYLRSISPGVPAELTLPEFPGKTFPGKVIRTSGSIDATSRTLLTEVEIPNANDELLAGMFGQIRFSLNINAPPLLIPSNALVITSDGVKVATLDQNNAVHLARVTLGRDFGTQVEIQGGLEENTRVVANPSDALTEGLVVEPLAPAKG